MADISMRKPSMKKPRPPFNSLEIQNFWIKIAKEDKPDMKILLDKRY